MKPTRPAIEEYVRAAAAAHGLDPDRFCRQCAAESSWDPDAVSRCGAVGLFQLMRPTAKELGVDPHDWKQNVLGAAEYMQKLLKLFDGDYAKALAAYNWGQGNVKRASIELGTIWRNALPKETKDYLRKILSQG